MKNNSMLPETMKAMVIEEQGKPLICRTLPLPQPEAGQVLVKVLACGICRTDLHVADGDLHTPVLPLIPGHEITGIIAATGGVTLLKTGDFVGIPWLGHTCGKCRYCLGGKENLCNEAKFTGYTMNGGYAEYTIANEHYCIPLPDAYRDPSMAPMLCAGLIGYRAYSMTDKDAQNIGIYGFGAAGHILTQIAAAQKKNIFAFTRDGDNESQALATRLGAVWAGSTAQTPPVLLDAAIIFAPAGDLVPLALRHTDKGGTVVCSGIHMSDIPSFPYNILWNERILRSVANLTRRDATAFLEATAGMALQTQVRFFPLSSVNEGLDCLRKGDIKGAAVLLVSQP